MGFIKTNHEIEDMGIVLDTAYAQITHLSIDVDGKANAMFSVQKDRESIIGKNHIDMVPYRCDIDKDLPVHKQVYEKAKMDVFADWEDDIVEAE